MQSLFLRFHRAQLFKWRTLWHSPKFVGIMFFSLETSFLVRKNSGKIELRRRNLNWRDRFFSRSRQKILWVLMKQSVMRRDFEVLENGSEYFSWEYEVTIVKERGFSPSDRTVKWARELNSGLDLKFWVGVELITKDPFRRKLTVDKRWFTNFIINWHFTRKLWIRRGSRTRWSCLKSLIYVSVASVGFSN